MTTPRVSAVMPAIHPYCSGAIGTCHGSDYFIADPETACVTSAKMQVLLIAMLLENGASKANYIIDNFIPRYKSIEEYFKAVSAVDQCKDAVLYNEDGTVTLDF